MTALVRFLPLAAMALLVLSMAWAAACGPADFHDDELWPDEGSGS